MAFSSSFKMPSSVPQDLLLIRDLVGDIPRPSVERPLNDADSSASDTDSEGEVEAHILGDLDDEELEKPAVLAPSDTTSDLGSSSDSDSDSDVGETSRSKGPKAAEKILEAEADDEDGPATVSAAQVRTKNEIIEASIIIPDISEVGPDEELERVGKVISIIDNVAIVKGLASQIANRASERALDSDTLLVFDDRKVLGYVFETFGPTTEPLYQIKFNEQYPLDPEKVQVSRQVFHVPNRSNFVFVSQLKRFKGSDASNIHDEEPADDEIEFSDDEQEAAHKREATRKREQSRSRSVSVVPSRHATPTPSQLRDQDMIVESYGATPLDQIAYNDMDLGAGPSRPQPIPYDDPYSDSYGIPEVQPEASTRSADIQDAGEIPATRSSLPDIVRKPERGRGRGRGQTQVRDMSDRRDDRGRGRGRGRDRRGRDRERGRGRGRGHGGMDRSGWSGHERAAGLPLPEEHHAQTLTPRSPSPTSLAIARATGQFADGTVYALDEHNAAGMPQDAGWGYSYYAQQPSQGEYAYGYQDNNAYVQPHINPRFATAFGLNMPMGFPNQFAGYAPDPYGAGYAGEWAGEWTQGEQGFGSGSGQNL